MTVRWRTATLIAGLLQAEIPNSLSRNEQPVVDCIPHPHSNSHRISLRTSQARATPCDSTAGREVMSLTAC